MVLLSHIPYPTASGYGEFLLAFDGRTHHLEESYWIKFEIKRGERANERPHGLSYSFTPHAPDGTRLVGLDNARGVPARGSRFKQRPEASDHWHWTESDPGRPQAFKDADTLFQDVFVPRRLSGSPQDTSRSRYSRDGCQG